MEQIRGWLKPREINVGRERRARNFGKVSRQDRAPFLNIDLGGHIMNTAVAPPEGP